MGRLIHTLARDGGDKVQETAYQYDLGGNLVRVANRHSITCFDYNGNGQIIGQHQWKVPIKEENARNGLPETDWRDAQYDMLYLPVTESIRYHYDFNGNLIHRELANGEVQNYFYDLHDQLVKAEIFKKDGTKETWAYIYDALGRRIGKGRMKNEEVSDSLEEETGFVWDGSHLLQEVQPDGRYTYLYTDQDSYEPLAQVFHNNQDEGLYLAYFHNDQISIPREMTDIHGNLLWYGEYTAWGCCHSWHLKDKCNRKK